MPGRFYGGLSHPTPSIFDIMVTTISWKDSTGGTRHPDKGRVSCPSQHRRSGMCEARGIATPSSNNGQLQTVDGRRDAKIIIWMKT